MREKHKDKIVPPWVNAEILRYQIPGGMLSNFFNQLKQLKLENKIDEVLAEVPRVREKLGYPPLVTPMSQMVGTQAMMNVASPKGPWSIVLVDTKTTSKANTASLREIDEEFRRQIIGDEPVMTERPADRLEPGWEKAKAQFPSLSDEDVLSRVMFPELFK